MDKIKRLAAKLIAPIATRFRSGWRNASRPKRLLIIIGVLVLGSFIIFLSAALTLSRAELSLLVLRREFSRAAAACHEKCRAARAERENLIADALKSDSASPGGSSRLTFQIKTHILDEAANPDFRKELVKILRLAYGPEGAPEYLLAYLDRSAANSDLKAAILEYFQPQGSPTAAADYYFSLLSGEVDLALKKEVILSLSNLDDKPANFTLSQLAIIKNLVLTPTTDRRLRASLVMLLADYYPLFKSQTASVLKNVYQAKDLNDRISQAMAADVLNHQSEAGKLALPEISAQEWNDYYNN